MDEWCDAVDVDAFVRSLPYVYVGPGEDDEGS